MWLDEILLVFLAFSSQIYGLFSLFHSLCYNYGCIGSMLSANLLQVIAERLSEEEIGGLKKLFKMIDTDNSGTITYDELKEGLRRVGSDLMESEIQALMDAVRILGPNMHVRCT